MGIYDRLIESVSNIRQDFKNSMRFLLPLLIGMAIALIALSHVITFLFENFPMQVNLFFIGLIVGIVPMLFKKAVEKDFKKVNVIPFIIMFALMIILAFVSKDTASTDTFIKMDFLQALRFCGVGFLAAVCLMLPGISGSMIMVIFGTYYSVINAIKTLDILYLIPAGIGILLGLIFGSKGINHCLKKYKNYTYFSIIGLVIGSILTIYFKSGFSFKATSIVTPITAIIFLVIGIAISYIFTSDKFTKMIAKKN